MQQEDWQLDCWQPKAAQELLQAGRRQRLDSQLTGAQRKVRWGAGAQQLGAQQEDWQLDCWPHEAGQELLQAGWQQGLDSQLTGAQRRVRRGAGAQQLGAQQGGSQQIGRASCRERV